MRIPRPIVAVLCALCLGAMGPAAVPESASPRTSTEAVATEAVSLDSGGQVRKPDAHGVAHLPAPNARRPKAARAPHTVLVHPQPGADPAKIAASAQGKVVETLPSGDVKITITGTPEAAVKSLGRNAEVASASLDRARYADGTPNDTYYATYQKYLATVRMPLAWGVQQSATGATIAIVDTGVDATHPDLTGHVLAGYNTVANSTNVTDTEGHGTMVAGIAAANTNNGTGVAGVAWNGRILPVKVFTGDIAYDSDIAEGITWAADHGAKVINLSLGGPGDDPTLRSAIQYAIGKGAIVVAAAGNTGDNALLYPGAYPEVLTVGATDTNASLTYFSTWGDNVDIVAPGWNITSTWSRNTSCGKTCLYATGAGTSFSAPIVSGVAALLKTRSPGLTPTQIADRLTSTARDAGPRGIDPYYGHGVLDAYAALGGAATNAFPLQSGGAYEPNDVPARAAELGNFNNAWPSATFAVAGDVDWYRFDLPATQWTDIGIKAAAWDDNRPQNADPVLEVYDRDLRLLATSDGPDPTAADGVRLGLTRGTYYIKVSNANGSADLRDYSLFYAPDPYDTRAPLFVDLNDRAAGEGHGNQANLAIGDVTGDNRPDLVLVANQYSAGVTDKLWVLPQRADGSLGDAIQYDTRMTGSDYLGITVVDANDDGRQDVAVTQKAGMEIFLQKGDGSFDVGTMVPGATDMRYAVRADIDGDGDDDLVTLSTTGIGLLIQDSPGQFSPRTIASNAAIYDVKVGDLNGDGRPDIAATDTESKEIRIYLQGGGSTWSVESYPADTDRLTDVEVGDVSGDGRADVVYTTGDFESGLRIRVQQPDGRLGPPQVLATANYVRAVEIADWDQDGLNDIFVDDVRVSLYRQSAPGVMEPVLRGDTDTSPLDGPQTWALGDLNSDGYPDVAAADVGQFLQGMQVAYNVNGTHQRGPQAWVTDTSIADFASTSRRARTAITIEMQRSLLASSVTGQTVRLLDGRTGAVVSGAVRYDAATKTITLSGMASRLRSGTAVPLAVRPGYPYRVVIGGVKDMSGNTFGGYSFTFTM